MNSHKNLWPFAIILAFVLFISGTVCLVIMACSHRVDLVSNNYYDQEIRFQSHIDQVRRTQALAAPASVVYDSTRQRITIALPREQTHQAIAGQIQLYRPSAASLDRRFELHPDSQGVQQLDASGLVPGFWKVRLLWTADGKDYFMDQKISLLAKAR
jgi:nitrogen fixation protein FixH